MTVAALEMHLHQIDDNQMNNDIEDDKYPIRRNLDMFKIIIISSLIIIALMTLVIMVLSKIKPSDSSADASNINNVYELYSMVSVDSSIICNDGTPAIFYLSTNPGSTTWHIALQGGDICEDQESCDFRQSTMPFAMSSDKQPPLLVEGLMNNDLTYNPNYYDSNKVILHYCTSDAWTGTSYASDNNLNLHFTGRLNLFAMIDELYNTHHLNQATEITFSGTPSASGLGVYLNIDDIVAHLNMKNTTIKGIADSSIFLHTTKTYLNRNITNIDIPSYAQAPHVRLEKGFHLWKPILAKCNAMHPTYTWQCYFINYTRYDMNAEMLYIQSLYDPESIRFAGVYDEELADDSAMKYIYENIVTTYLTMFNDVDFPLFVFAPACYSHMNTLNNVFVSSTVVNSNTLNSFISEWVNGNIVSEIETNQIQYELNPTCPVWTPPPPPP